MKKLGKVVFGIGVFLAVTMGVIVSIDPGYVCHLDAENLQTGIWDYPALCFVSWAFSVPLGFIIAGTGLLIYANAKLKTILQFGLGTLGTYLFISFANGPMPHVPVLFGVEGTLIMSFYFLILWQNADRFKENTYKLAGYTFLVTGFWFTCGLASRLYQPMLGSGESPIDIGTYFVLSMLFFWLSERRHGKVS
ncbi:MAG: hypothetical protein WBV45_08200 [Lutimonas sp.]